MPGDTKNLQSNKALSTKEKTKEKIFRPYEANVIMVLIGQITIRHRI